jgi:hypothetical protein
MKSVFLAVLLVMGLVAQTKADEVSWGIRGGFTLAAQTGTADSMLIGLTTGIFADLNLGGRFSFQPELDFTMKGTHIGGAISVPGQPAGLSVDDYFDYFELPLLLKVTKDLSRMMTGSLSAGPSFGILLNPNDHYAIGNYPHGQTITGAPADIGLMVGAGIEMDQLLFDLRYEMGLVSAYANSPDGPQNNTLSLQVGYRIE